MNRTSHHEVAIEESLSDGWSEDLGVVEVPLDERPFFHFGVLAFLITVALAGRIAWIGLAEGSFYRVRAEVNQFQ
ncbi:MAG: hypothetical protein RL681_693, partial [Candidatus Parcubacteria bacterium]